MRFHMDILLKWKIYKNTCSLILRGDIQECLLPSWVEIDPEVLEKKKAILNFNLHHNCLPLKKDVTFHLNKPQSSTQKDASAMYS